MKLKIEQVIPPTGFPERRLKEILGWLVNGKTRVPAEVKADINRFYGYLIKFMEFDTEKYGITWKFKNNEIVFTQDSSGEIWARIVEEE